MTTPNLKAPLGIIGGSTTWGARFPEDFPDDRVRVVQRFASIDTPFGPSAPFKVLEVTGNSRKTALALYVPMHGLFPSKIDQIVPWIAAKQIAWIFIMAGVKHALTGGSVGGIQDDNGNPLPPWSVLIPDDVLLMSVPPTPDTNGRIARSRRNVFHRMAQPFCPVLSDILLESTADYRKGAVHMGGVYATTMVGHFETRVQIANLRAQGTSVVGQTVGYEAVAMVEAGINLACLNIVSNHAEDGGEWIGTQPDDMTKFYLECPHHMAPILINALAMMADGVPECDCDRFALKGLEQFPVDGA